MAFKCVFSYLSVVSKSVVTQNLVILLNSLCKGVCELCVAPCVETSMLSNWAGWVNPWKASAGGG
jgi:Na+-translocating ferredoxin:NAD+ oxidoreductase RNF subunit RnfB